MKELFRTVERKMKHAVDHFHDELKRLRTGRASLGMLDGVTVEYYGTPTPLNQVPNLSVADANLIVAQPWDPSTIPAIQRGITQANLGLNPSSDGKVIRIPVPPLTEDRRKELVQARRTTTPSTRATACARRAARATTQLKAMEKKHEHLPGRRAPRPRRGAEAARPLHRARSTAPCSTRRRTS